MCSRSEASARESVKLVDSADVRVGERAGAQEVFMSRSEEDLGGATLGLGVAGVTGAGAALAEEAGGAVASGSVGVGLGGSGGRREGDDVGGGSGTEFAQPHRSGAMTADGGVDPMRDTGEAGNDGFEAGPEGDTLEDGIHEIRDWAVVGVLRISVVEAVVLGGLEDVPVLEEGNETAVFLAGAVGPLVDFIGIDAEGDEEAELPAEEAERPGGEEEQCAHEHEVARAVPPRQMGEEAGVVVVDDVGSDEEGPDEGRIFREVGVFSPVDDAGDKVGDGGDEDDLERSAENRDEQVHGDGWILIWLSCGPV